MRQIIAYRAIAAVVLSLCLAGRAAAAEDRCCCAHCGCQQACQKVCRLVCEDKKVEVICWGCLCEDFCLPKHDKPGCEHCKMVCAECDQPCVEGAPYAAPKRFVWTDWIPGCATMHSRTKLMKKSEMVTVHSFKWVVEDLCPTCESRCDVAEVAPGDDVPAPPETADAKLLYGRK